MQGPAASELGQKLRAFAELRETKYTDEVLEEMEENEGDAARMVPKFAGFLCEHSYAGTLSAKGLKGKDAALYVGSHISAMDWLARDRSVGCAPGCLCASIVTSCLVYTPHA
jgi:hypothetical protein